MQHKQNNQIINKPVFSCQQYKMKPVYFGSIPDFALQSAHSGAIILYCVQVGHKKMIYRRKKRYADGRSYGTEND